jgi:hypothetical protein
MSSSTGISIHSDLLLLNGILDTAISHLPYVRQIHPTSTGWTVMSVSGIEIGICSDPSTVDIEFVRFGYGTFIETCTTSFCIDERTIVMTAIFARV